MSANEEYGDQTQAAAILAAERYLDKMGWKYTPVDVGEWAAKLLKGMRKEIANVK